MTRSRPKALVTAAVSGPGLDLLHQLADLVLDSWLDQPTLRIYNADPAGRAGGGRGRLHRDRRERRLRRRALRAAHHRRVQLPRRPDQRRRAGRHRGRRARAAGPGPQRRRGGRAGRRPALRRHPGRRAGRPRRARGRDLPRREDPLPALPGLGAGRQDGRPGGARRGGARPALAPARPGHGGARLRPLRSRRHQLARRAAGPLRRDLGPRAGDRGDDRHDRRRRLRQDARRRRLPQHGAGQDPRHRRAGRGAGLGQGRRRRGSTTSRASTWRPTTRSPRSPRSC